jgi:hypothetical protein
MGADWPRSLVFFFTAWKAASGNLSWEAALFPVKREQRQRRRMLACVRGGFPRSGKAFFFFDTGQNVAWLPNMVKLCTRARKHRVPSS